MRTATILFLMFLLSIASCRKTKLHNNYSNVISSERMLLVLSAPSVHDNYYQNIFNNIVEFQINYAKKILGHDNVVIIVDNDTKKYYSDKLPDDVLLVDDIYDIWMRDFTTINPLNPVQVKYTHASMSEQESVEVQASFTAFANKYNLTREFSNLVIDGGNIVDNYAGSIITTTRFLDDNNLTFSEGKQILCDQLQVDKVAIIEPDDDVLAHADGMVSWLNDSVLLVNDYSQAPSFRDSVMSELELSFPDVKIVEVPVHFSESDSSQWGGISSACGVNLNSTVTYKNVYVPTFGSEFDQRALDLIRTYSGKNVIEVDAQGVCEMGGSVRCLTWQQIGDNASKLIIAARED